MFHSSGFFSGMLCPYYGHGLCHRSYCHYRHSTRKRLPPRKRPQLKTKYTSYPSAASTSSVAAGSSEGGPSGGESISEQNEGSGDVRDGGEDGSDVRDGGEDGSDVRDGGEDGSDVRDGGEDGSGARDGGEEERGRNYVGAVVNFYGATSNSEEKGGQEGECHGGGSEIGMGAIADDQPGAIMELPSYAPNVCGETVIGFEGEVVNEECSGNEVKENQTLEIDPVTMEIATTEDEPHPPTSGTDDVTESDIFGSTDEDMEPPSDSDVGTVEDGEEVEDGGEVGDGGEVEEGEGGRETEMEEMRAVFQSTLQAQTDSSKALSLKRKCNDAGEEYPSTSQKKRRIALPKAEMYRQHNSSSAVRAKPKITSNFAASLDREALYMGRKRTALTPTTVTTVTAGSASTTPARPRIPLMTNSKVPTKLRQRYLDSFIDEILKVTLDPHTAYKKAEEEEGQLFQHCSSRMTYCSRASHTLQRLRREAIEFLEKQRESSDARVRAHSDGGGCGSNKTTPTRVEEAETGIKRSENIDKDSSARGSCSTQSSKKSLKLSRKGKASSCVSTGASSPSLGSPVPSLSSGLSQKLVERCRSVEVRLTKCAVGRGSKETVTSGIPEDVLISTESEPESAVTASQFYSTTVRHNPTVSSSEEMARKKKKKDKEKKETRKKSGTEDSGKRHSVRSSSTSSRDGRGEKIETNRSTPLPVEDHQVTTPVSSQLSRTASRGHSSSDTLALKSELFGDSDSDCVVLSSPCSSGEEEIMNISFEEALKGVEVRGGRGRSVVGKRKPGVELRGRGGGREVVVVVGKGKERGTVRGKVGGEGRGRSDHLSHTRRRSVNIKDKQLERRPSNEAAALESISDDVIFKPDTQSLVNLSAIAKSHRLAQSTTPRRLSSSDDDVLFKPHTQSLVTIAKSHQPKQSTVHRHQSLSSSSVSAVSTSQGSRNTPSSTAVAARPSYSIFKKKELTLTAPIFYALMQRYLMTQQQLIDNGYPQPTQREGVASINWGGDSPPTIQPVGTNAMRHRCCRCGKPFIIYSDGQYQTVEDCIHHWGRLIKVKEYGEGIVSQYSCCSERRDSAGCQVAKMHVTAGTRPAQCAGYVQTQPPPSPSPSPSSSSSSSVETVYALDCEMCYTTSGLELTRVSLVDMDLKPVYESLVLPPHPIVDYNTRFSGLRPEDFVSVTTTLEQVQQRMLSLVASETILLGHSLESDLRALKIIHNSVVDTAIVFPHRRGPPLKRALRTLMKEFMQKFIQDNVDGGHDSLEDARACMELMLWKVKGDLQQTTRRISTQS